MIRSHLLCALAALALLACKSKEKDKAAAPPPASEVKAPTEAKASTALGAGPFTITRLPSRIVSRTNAAGQTREWQALGGIEVKDESIKELYESRGSHFIGFQATVQVAGENCLVRYKSELVAGTSDKDRAIESITGVVPAPAGESLVLSGVIGLSPKDAGRVGSVRVGYWTLCGPALPSPSAFDFQITKTDTEELELGNSFQLHHTVMDVQSTPVEAGEASRCHFHLVAEDVDAEGYTLNRDFSTYSLRPGKSGQIKLRRSAFEGGSELDYKAAGKGKRSYVKRVICDEPWEADATKIEGLQISELALHRYQSDVVNPEELTQASFDHSATIKNTTGKDCSFRVRYAILDVEGFAMHRSPALTETLHLHKGPKSSYRSEKHRLYTWLDQADDVGKLVVQEATPIKDCTSFDPKKALAK